MAKLPPNKRIHIEEIPDAPDWMRPVLITLNSFMQNVWEALNRQLNLRDNLTSQIVDVTYVGGERFSFQTSIQGNVTAVLIAQIQGGPITGGVAVNWQQIGQLIEIAEIAGLTAGQSYRVRLLLL